MQVKKNKLDDLEENKIFDKKKGETNDFSKRIKTIIKNRSLFYLLNVFDIVNSDEEKVMFFIMELNEMNIYTFNKIISKRFLWSCTKAKRVVDRLLEKKLIERVNKCFGCGRGYKRIPKWCLDKNCSELLIKNKDFEDRKNNRPQFLIKITQKGKDFVIIRCNDYHSSLGLYAQRLNSIKLKSIRSSGK